MKEDPTFLIDPFFDSSASVDARGHTIAIANGRDPEVRVMDDEFRLRLIVRWHDPGRQVTPEHVRAARDAVEEWARRDGELSASDRARLSPDRPAADVLPAVRRVCCGSIWVFPESVPGESEPPRPMGFDADGRFLCHRRTCRGTSTSGRWAPTTRWVYGRASSTCRWWRSTAWPGRELLWIDRRPGGHRPATEAATSSAGPHPLLETHSRSTRVVGFGIRSAFQPGGEPHDRTHKNRIGDIVRGSHRSLDTGFGNRLRRSIRPGPQNRGRQRRGHDRHRRPAR